jgi:hypothetical protein
VEESIASMYTKSSIEQMVGWLISSGSHYGQGHNGS